MRDINQKSNSYVLVITQRKHIQIDRHYRRKKLMPVLGIRSNHSSVFHKKINVKTKLN